jgi:predicted transcriptional regulator
MTLPKIRRPVSEMIDQYHPMNSEFHKQSDAIKNSMVDLQMEMSNRDVQAVKLASKGLIQKQIADEIGVCSITVSKLMKQEKSIELLSLIRHLSALHEGPTAEHRKRVLWEITVENKLGEPKTAISAIAEMNKMDGIGKEKADTNINIQINADMFPRGALDG